jgi:hypothetical protein
MLSYVIRRVLATIPVMAVVALFVFSLLYVAPGDPAAVIVGYQAAPADVERISASLGLVGPFLVCFGEWLWQVLHGDLGTSIFTNLPVSAMIAQRLEPTVSLMAVTLVFAVPVAVLIGVIAAWMADTLVDRAIVAFAVQLRLCGHQSRNRPHLHRARPEDQVLTAPPPLIIAAMAPDAVTTAMAPDLMDSAPELPELFRPIRRRRGFTRFLYRHPAIVLGGALVLAMLAIAVLAPYLGTIDPTAPPPARANRRPNSGSAPTCWGATSIPASSMARGCRLWSASRSPCSPRRSCLRSASSADSCAGPMASSCA